MSNIMKHVGRYGEKPCVVVFREVPNEPENCLVVQTGQLSDTHHDSLMEVVQSPEGQQANEISEVLSRRQFPDGENMLNGLHFGKKMQKVPVSMVTLTPTPAQSVPLQDVNAELRKIENNATYDLKTDAGQLDRNEKPGVAEAAVEAKVEADAEGIASNLLAQAELMEQDAERILAEAKEKKAQAFEMAPELKPKRGPGRPPKDAD